jgi:hypothetical protein
LNRIQTIFHLVFADITTLLQLLDSILSIFSNISDRDLALFTDAFALQGI